MRRPGQEEEVGFKSGVWSCWLGEVELHGLLYVRAYIHVEREG